MNLFVGGSLCQATTVKRNKASPRSGTGAFESLQSYWSDIQSTCRFPADLWGRDPEGEGPRVRISQVQSAF